MNQENKKLKKVFVMQDVIWVKTKKQNKTKIENKKPLGVESLTLSSFKSGLILTS